MKIARQHGGAFLCDGVGLGKTFVGLMLIERLVLHEGKRVVLFVPKAARKACGSRTCAGTLPHIGGGAQRLQQPRRLQPHRPSAAAGRLPGALPAQSRELADVVVIDEAHHFRNPGVRAEGGRRAAVALLPALRHLRRASRLFMLTATPINNRLSDFRHMVELFTRREATYFAAAPLGHPISAPALQQDGEGISRSVWPSTATDVAATTSRPIRPRSSACSAATSSSASSSSSAAAPTRARARGSTAAGRPSSRSARRRRSPEYSIRKTYGRLLDMLREGLQQEEAALHACRCTTRSPTTRATIQTRSQPWRRPAEAGRRPDPHQFLKRFESSPRPSSSPAGGCSRSSSPSSRCTARPTARRSAWSAGSSSTPSCSAT